MIFRQLAHQSHRTPSRRNAGAVVNRELRIEIQTSMFGVSEASPITPYDKK